MGEGFWAGTAVDWLTAAGALATPIVVGCLAYRFSGRLSRNEALSTARLEYYQSLAPDLNLLMCYFTFIGRWKEINPPRIVALKRSLDERFFIAAPLFSEDVAERYQNLMVQCFSTFGGWGKDAKFRTSAYRRRPCLVPWDPSWDEYFEYDDSQPIPASESLGIRNAYDLLLSAMVKDIEISDARSRYTTQDVSINMHSPAYRDIEGSD
jgi:hypothetical protein